MMHRVYVYIGALCYSASPANHIYIYTVQVAKYKGEATPINNVM